MSICIYMLDPIVYIYMHQLSDHFILCYSDKGTKWVKVDENSTLEDVLKQPDFVIPGIPGGFEFIFYFFSKLITHVSQFIYNIPIRFL